MPKTEENLILVASPLEIFPQTGGGTARILSLITFLRSQGWRVGLVGVHHTNDALDELKRHVDRLWIYRSPHPPRPNLKAGPVSHDPEPPDVIDHLWHYLRCATYALLHPFEVKPASGLESARDEHFDAYVRKVTREVHPAAVISIFAWTARALEDPPPGTLTLLDTIDIQHERAEVARQAGDDLSRTACTREEEIDELMRANVLLAIQATEAEKLREMCPEREVILAEHAQPVRERPWPVADGNADLLFVGNLYEPNVSGLRRFLEEVWPLLRAQVPHVRLHVCGRVCRAFESETNTGVVLHGLVPELDVFYREATLVINPVFYGTGLKIKTVEALSHGKCVVATPGGLQGLGWEGEPPCAITSLEKMADTIAQLIAHPERRRERELHALEYARPRFTPEVVYRGLCQRLEAHIQQIKEDA